MKFKTRNSFGNLMHLFFKKFLNGKLTFVIQEGLKIKRPQTGFTKKESENIVTGR